MDRQSDEHWHAPGYFFTTTNETVDVDGRGAAEISFWEFSENISPKEIGSRKLTTICMRH